MATVKVYAFTDNGTRRAQYRYWATRQQVVFRRL